MILKLKLKKTSKYFLKYIFKKYLKSKNKEERFTSYENMLLSLMNMILMVHPIISGTEKRIQ